MERSRMIGSVDNFDGQQNLQEWIQMVNRAAEFAGWTDDATFKAAMFRLRGEAGEHAEQLKSEGKITSWPELQVALKDRFETAGKEQWHQFLLNTGTQGSKTVQEWAQTVRMLSLRALGSEALGIKEEGEEPMTAEQKLIAETAQKEARKNLLDFMRRTNFVRGLRSNLRQMVWRRKCKTFDDAVKTAAEEEAVEASHREEEVLSCYVKGFPEPTTTGLVEKIVAALEMREEERKEKKEKGIDKMKPRQIINMGTWLLIIWMCLDTSNSLQEPGDGTEERERVIPGLHSGLLFQPKGPLLLATGVWTAVEADERRPTKEEEEEARALPQTPRAQRQGLELHDYAS
ncbi:hypothetical protein FJT64_017275 [Amphibalanus amphitrite]|uniref:Retrotransposon gag domain-containing protein n=1 Tax=Amphibalanus amphitrite TaxID=1232801 RepID=A0A6A4XC86_AMPAM|nr:hypothetical protein FJT64_017275 [Amphibalanus amphitrite]